MKKILLVIAILIIKLSLNAQTINISHLKMMCNMSTIEISTFLGKDYKHKESFRKNYNVYENAWNYEPANLETQIYKTYRETKEGTKYVIGLTTTNFNIYNKIKQEIKNNYTFYTFKNGYIYYSSEFLFIYTKQDQPNGSCKYLVSVITR